MNKNKLRFITYRSKDSNLPIKILARPFYTGVNVTLKAKKSQAKEIKRLLIQKKIQVVLTSMDDNNAE